MLQYKIIPEENVAHIFLTQEKVTVLDLEDLDKCSPYRWHAHEGKRTFYSVTNLKKPNGRWTTTFLHRLVSPQYEEVDHIDRNGLNNRKSNHREGKEVNPQNLPLSKRNTSGYKGVNWREDKKKWHARIMLNRKRLHLGYFNDPEAAAHAVDAAVKEHYPSNAYLNFP